MPILPSFPLAGFILFAFAASHAGAQARIVPLNPGPNFESVQTASLIHDTVDSSGNTARNPTAPDATAPDSQSALPNAPAQNDEDICGITHVGRCLKDLGQDEVGIYTSPLRVKPKDAYWLAPLGAATGLAFPMTPMPSKRQG